MFQLQDKWESRATVRSRPHLVVDMQGKGYFYPVSKQPIAIHSKLRQKGLDAINYLLIQSFYKYSNDISKIETKVVNQTILKVIADQLPLSFSDEQKINLYTIMVDESYHAYVAFDSALQIEHHTSIKPLELPKEIEIERAITSIKKRLAPEYHNVFDLITVCIAENTLTKDIVFMSEEEDTHPFFQKLITDHLADESRHSGIFFHILEYVWANITVDFKRNIGAVLTDFLDLYLGVETQKEFDKMTLMHLNFSEQESDLILNDTYGGFELTSKHPMLSNIITILTKAKIMDEYTLPQFKKRNWVSI
jgi:hypothetical protein